MDRSLPSPSGADVDGELLLAVERAALAIGRLDARVSASSVAPAWHRRAAWTGYARALQLHGTEIDEIDVFSWGSGVHVPGRPARHTLVDEFSAFDPWLIRLQAQGRHWAEDLPFTVAQAPDRPRPPALLRTLSLLSEYLRAERSLDAWLSVPILLHRLGVTERPLPCLVAGDRRLIHPLRDMAPTWRRILRELEESAIAGGKCLTSIEDARAMAVAAIAAERRPSALHRLSALLLSAPVQSPEAVARKLKLTLSGAGKLLTRAAGLGLVVEVSGRKAWRTYVSPDLAVALGLLSAPRGRPAARPPSPEPVGDLRSVLAAFDRELADFDARFGEPQV